MWLQREEEEEEPLTEMEQYVQHNQLQWEYFNELIHEVHNVGVYGEYLEFLLSELQHGPYWSDVREHFGTVREPEEEWEPEPSVSGTRTRQLEPDSDSDSDTGALFFIFFCT